MIPIAKILNRVMESSDDEIAIHDLSSQLSCQLNAVTVKVLELCDGKNTIQEIAQKLEKILNLQSHPDIDIRRLVWFSLQELEQCHLLEDEITIHQWMEVISPTYLEQIKPIYQQLITQVIGSYSS